MTAPIVFLDCETTSLRDDRRPWEIAMIRRGGDGKESATVIVIDEVDLTVADPQALAVGGFYQRHYQYGSGLRGENGPAGTGGRTVRRDSPPARHSPAGRCRESATNRGTAMIDNYLRTIEADEQRTCEHTDPLHVYRTRFDDEYGPTRRDEADR